MSHEELETELIARELYNTYCESAGWVAHNGQQLPSWERFYSDRDKQKQVRAWLDTGARARSLGARPSGC